MELPPLPTKPHVAPPDHPSRYAPPPMQDYSKLPAAALRAKNRRPSLPELWEEGGRPTAIDFILPQRIPPRPRQNTDSDPSSSSTHAKDGAQTVAPGMEYAHVPLQVQIAAAAAAANPKGPMLPTPDQSDTSSMSGGGGARPPGHESIDLMQQNQMNAAIQMAFAQSQQQSMMGSPYSAPTMPLTPLSLNPAMSDTSSMGSGMSYLELRQPPADPGPSSVAAAMTTPHLPHAQAMMTNLGMVPTNNNPMTHNPMMQPPDINPAMVSLSPHATLHPRIISPSQYSMGSHTFQTPFYSPGAPFVNAPFNMIPSPVQPRLPMHTPCSHHPQSNHSIYAELATIGENMRRSGAASNAPIMFPASWGTPVRIASVQHPEISLPHPSLSPTNLVTAEHQPLTQTMDSTLRTTAMDANQGQPSPQMYPSGQQPHYAPGSHTPESSDHHE
ncbi:hypothetical protein H4R34_002665 [Dimargaris verticillata]|uniref:Uncharacterized protein n=1 Tax=Dimargaris verticillata TaxID=2761393 RepID=A0A9W8E9S2_9FUNG|nr:hypothetical protein H4R34_002665 [Dimargaris verticillata]